MLLQTIGLKIVAIKGFNTEYDASNHNKKKKKIEPEFIFFSDKKTFIQLEEQDYFTFHDCSTIAREIKVMQDKEQYKNFITSPNLSDANTEI